ncbi:hypothetical protein XU18_2527 [Perkinsela sp. CCAP 1560/4]|nr:hypothetical protein XU18_2527 [Perkinsela sp. CCAP 1560/4]|eukprot:KNH06626.1 hypothetical protein XU18_2527 [Perkinsela sp. CCAP 1560/4]
MQTPTKKHEVLASKDMIPSLPAHAISKGISPSVFGYDQDIIAKHTRDGDLREECFNFGFDRKTWEMYVARHNSGNFRG